MMQFSESATSGQGIFGNRGWQKMQDLRPLPSPTPPHEEDLRAGPGIANELGHNFLGTEHILTVFAER